MTEQEIDQLAQRNATRRWREMHHIPEGSEVLYDDASWRELYEEEIRTLREEEIRREEARREELLADERRRVEEYDARQRAASPSVAPVAPCPFVGPPAPPTTIRRDCQFAKFSVHERDDSDRVYDSTTHNGEQAFLEIVGGASVNPAYVQAELDTASTSCPTHRNRVHTTSPSLRIENLPDNGDGKERIEFRPAWRGDSSNFGFWNAHIRPTEYRITATNHSNTATCLLRVYPDIAWEGSVTLVMSADTFRSSIQVDRLDINISKTFDGHTQNFGGNIGEAIRIFANYLITAVLEVKTISETVTQGTARIRPIPPSVTLSVNSCWQKTQARRTCGYYLNFRLRAEPLFGIEYDIMLSRLAIQAIPYIGSLVLSVAGDAIDQFITIRFTLSGRVNGNINYTYQTNGSDRQTTGTISGIVGVELFIGGQIRRDYSFVSINCGINGGARSSFSITVSGPLRQANGTFIGLTINFDGLSVFAGASCRMGASRDQERELTDGAPGTGSERTYQWIGPRQFTDWRYGL